MRRQGNDIQLVPKVFPILWLLKETIDGIHWNFSYWITYRIRSLAPLGSLLFIFFNNCCCTTRWSNFRLTSWPKLGKFRGLQNYISFYTKELHLRFHQSVKLHMHLVHITDYLSRYLLCNAKRYTLQYLQVKSSVEVNQIYFNVSEFQF